MSELITTLDQINDNISNFEELSNERKKDFLSKYYATPRTTYYLAYRCSGSEKYHFLWGKYIGYEWGGVDKYNPDLIHGSKTKECIKKVLKMEPTYSDDLWHDFVDYSNSFGLDVSSKKENVFFWVLDRENDTANCYLRFKKLLEYFVAHLEYNENFQDGVFPEINNSFTKGYDQYIFPQKGSFVRTGTGYDGGRIQNAVNQWAEYDYGKIFLNVSPNYGKYTSALCYLNWKDTSVNVNACWVNKQVVALKACFVVKKESEEKFKKKGEETIVPETSLNDLGLFDNTASTNDCLKDFFNKFYKYYLKYVGITVGEEKMKNIGQYKNIIFSKKNIILQGAPGTGKTYATAALALSIIDKLHPHEANEKEFHKKVMDEYEKHLVKFDDDGNIMGDGQIGFVTFHQSMDYEDFVEGIKPIERNESIFYKIQAGIFKSLCKLATPKSSDSVDNFEESWEKIVDALDESNKIAIPLLKGEGTFDIEMNEYGDGLATRTYENGQTEWVRGKSRFFSKEQLYRVYQNLPGIPSGGHDNYRKAVIKEMKNKFGLKEYVKGSSDAKTSKNYVLIIDEINRGNVSKIFGELISLLEADKRTDGDHPLVVTLPYSKEQFSVPSNLYIIGTMNTTDRSVGSIDYAVRRRFAFVTLEADEKLVPEGDAQNLFKAVKNFLEKNKYDMDIEDLMVGHSYFMVKTKNDLEMKWQYEILPLLMEYHKDGIISKSPLKDAADKDIADVKKNYANFTAAWKKPDSDTSNS